jgi:hypothetical protein
VAAVTAVVGAAIVFIIAENMLGLSLTLPVPPRYQALSPLDVADIAWATVPPALGAALLLVILDHRLSRPVHVFRVIAAFGLLVSFGGPRSLPVGTSTKIVLGRPHVVAAGGIVGSLPMLGHAA